MSQQVRVGVGVFILRRSPPSDSGNPTFLIGKRKGSHGAGTYALPGGHLEFNESPEECAAREVLEETGLRIKDIKFLTATNDIMTEEGKHYITMFMVCEREDEGVEAAVLEPDKCEHWDWVKWRSLAARGRRNDEYEDGKEKWFLPLVNLLKQRPGVVPTLD